MALSAETSAWLEGLRKDGGISDESYNSLKKDVESSSKADQHIKDSVLRQSDYTKNINEVQKAQAEVTRSQQLLKDREEAVTKFQAELGTWKQGAEGSFNKALQEREQAERKQAAAVAKLKALAVAQGLNEDDVLKDLDLPVETNNNNQNLPKGFDPSKYLTREEVNRATSEAALLDALIYDIGEEHRDLFGSRLPNAKGMVEEAIKSGKGLREFWADKYKVQDKIKEQQEAAVQKRIDTAVAEKEMSLRSQLSIPAPRHDANPYNTRPLFDNEKVMNVAQEHNSQVGSSSGVSAAVAAFQEGKHRTDFKR